MTVDTAPAFLASEMGDGDTQYVLADSAQEAIRVYKALSGLDTDDLDVPVEVWLSEQPIPADDPAFKSAFYEGGGTRTWWVPVTDVSQGAVRYWRFG